MAHSKIEIEWSEGGLSGRDEQYPKHVEYCGPCDSKLGAGPSYMLPTDFEFCPYCGEAVEHGSEEEASERVGPRPDYRKTGGPCAAPSMVSRAKLACRNSYDVVSHYQVRAKTEGDVHRTWNRHLVAPRDFIIREEDWGPWKLVQERPFGGEANGKQDGC